MIYDCLTQLIGNTPLLRLHGLEKNDNLSACIFAKLEYFNPLGSVKDRAALFMLDDAQKRGEIKNDTVIIEPTSGNTGIGLAYICAIRGYKLILTMPESMSEERKNLLRALGAQLVLTDSAAGMDGAIKKALALKGEYDSAFIPMQFENPANKAAHFETTGPELWRDTDGELDVFVASVGTGGTLSGTAEYLKKMNPNIKIVAVEPYESAVLSGQKKGAHGIQGIGAGFVPSILNTDIIDEIVAVKTPDAYKYARTAVKTDGLFVGMSSGAALCAAAMLAKRGEYHDKRIVALLPDSGERYLSTPLFRED